MIIIIRKKYLLTPPNCTVNSMGTASSRPKPLPCEGTQTPKHTACITLKGRYLVQNATCTSFSYLRIIGQGAFTTKKLYQLNRETREMFVVGVDNQKGTPSSQQMLEKEVWAVQKLNAIKAQKRACFLRAFVAKNLDPGPEFLVIQEAYDHDIHPLGVFRSTEQLLYHMFQMIGKQLGYLFRHGLLYLDIKSENIVYRERDHVFSLCDFSSIVPCKSDIRYNVRDIVMTKEMLCVRLYNLQLTEHVLRQVIAYKLSLIYFEASCSSTPPHIQTLIEVVFSTWTTSNAIKLEHSIRQTSVYAYLCKMLDSLLSST